ncbi:MAG: GNAT family N-acetyltransferase [Methanomicrobia archaeon]|nr:GNAT family N-acetyltransferase [Methanomicrobia archaeon]
MIREAKISDTEEIVSCVRNVMREAWERYEKGYYPRKAIDFDLKYFNKERVEKMINSENTFLFIAEEDKIIGVVHGILYGESGFGMIHWFGVEFEYQEKGIGKQLLEKVFEYCKKKKIHKISLYTFPVLRSAINLYLKTGFVPEAYLKKQWWGVDFIFMSKWL